MKETWFLAIRFRAKNVLSNKCECSKMSGISDLHALYDFYYYRSSILYAVPGFIQRPQVLEWSSELQI